MEELSPRLFSFRQPPTAAAPDCHGLGHLRNLQTFEAGGAGFRSLAGVAPIAPGARRQQLYFSRAVSVVGCKPSARNLTALEQLTLGAAQITSCRAVRADRRAGRQTSIAKGPG